MNAREWYCKRDDVTEPNLLTLINTNFMFDLMEEYAEAYHQFKIGEDTSPDIFETLGEMFKPE